MPKRVNKNNWPVYNLLSVVSVGVFLTIGIASDALKMTMLVSLVEKFGVPGIVFVLWYFSNRTNQQTLQQYHDDMQEIRQMYENNVKLVEDYHTATERQEKINIELISVISLNTETMATLASAIKTNQFCPQVRKAGPNDES